MRDSKLASIATRLVETATEISKSIEGASQLRELFLREVRKIQRCADAVVPTEMLGLAGRGFREHVEHQLARRIVHEAVKNIDFDVSRDDCESWANRTTRFTAKAYVLTQGELTKLIDDAIEIGKRS